MAIVSEDPHFSCYDIKSADLPLLALVLKTDDLSAITRSLQAQWAENPGFFDQDPVMVDVGLLQAQGLLALDLSALLPVLREHGLWPMAIKGAQEPLLSQALAMGLVQANDARIRRSVAVLDTLPADSAASSVSASARPAAEAPLPTAVPVLTVPGNAEPMVIDKPLRSGQQVYAKGRDLIVLAMVNAGAEVIADGNIHIYAALRGKAIAGARGNVHARIFAQSMAPELISIAGIYRTSENPLPKDVSGQAAQVCLVSGPEGDKLLITPLKT